MRSHPTLTAAALAVALAGAAGCTTAGRVAQAQDCAAIARDSPRTFYERNRSLTDARNDSGRWDPAEPAAAGLDAAALAAAGDWLDAQPGLRALVVLRGGKLAHERYFDGADARQSNNVHSACKSILQALVGLAVARGELAGLDAAVADYLPDHAPAGTPAGRITVGQLLTMTAGLRWREDSTEERVQESADWVRAILELPPAERTGFRYSTGNTHVLSALLTAATGRSTCDYAAEHLFAPLGIMPERWTRDPQGVYAGGFNMYLTARELARFGQLYLADGVWAGRRLLPRDTVAQSRTVTATDVGQPGYQYAAGWWATTVAGHAAQVAWGFGGQYVAVVPDLDLVVATTQSTRGGEAESRELDLRAFLAEHLLPAVR